MRGWWLIQVLSRQRFNLQRRLRDPHFTYVLASQKIRKAILASETVSLSGICANLTEDHEDDLRLKDFEVPLNEKPKLNKKITITRSFKRCK